MTEFQREMVAEMVRLDREQPAPPPAPVGPRTVHHLDLVEDTSGGVLSGEWNVFRREVGRLLAEGHDGRWVLITGDRIVGVYDTRADATAAGYSQFYGRPFFTKSIRERYPLVRAQGQYFVWD